MKVELENSRIYLYHSSPRGLQGVCEKTDCLCKKPGKKERQKTGAKKGAGNRRFHRIRSGQRITTRFWLWGATIGIMFEKPSGKRTATPGWYNTAAYEEEAQQAGTLRNPLMAMLSKAVKEETVP